MGACSERIVGELDFKKSEPYDARRTRLREYPIRQPEPYLIIFLTGLFFMAFANSRIAANSPLN